jgi:hypothetical protein
VVRPVKEGAGPSEGGDPTPNQEGKRSLQNPTRNGRM